MEEFFSERLYIRKLSARDYSLVSDIFMNEEIMRYALADCIRNESAMRHFFLALFEPGHIDRTTLSYLVFMKHGRMHVGFADLELRHDGGSPGVAEIGYFLKPQYWGNGFATETARCLVEFCFTGLGVRKVNAGCNALNAGSENVMKKLGMKKEGELRLERYKNDEWCDELRYGIMSEEWLAMRGLSDERDGNQKNEV